MKISIQLSSIYKRTIYIVFHARIQEFSSGGGGGGGVQVSLSKKALTTFFFLSSAYFTEFKWSISKKSIIFQGSRGGPTFSRGGGGGPTFSKGGGGPIAYSL